MKRRFNAIIILLAAAAGIFWFFYPLRSIIVMSIYSNQHANDSVMKRAGFEIDMPSGKGWYPFVMTYNASGFDEWAGMDAQMSIMYNFGAFDALGRTSAIYDVSSSQYSSFYGAYVVRDNGNQFGFTDGGAVDMTEVSLAVEYDYTQLVIKDFGCADRVFLVDDYTIVQSVDYIGSGGWTRIDAVIVANGAAHNYDGHKTPYLQYGRPMEKVEVDFDVTTLYGRVYAKYLDEYSCTVMIYVIAPSKAAVDACDENILAKTVIG